ncbi:restriction endonuclease [Sutcliffiella horikoshii]|uniref:nSTAND3 domain-containing NTPase n=1 Tax=Sutcliffiella horikoshii TaxID=79883 RepID=UPI00384D3B80
MGNYDLSVLSPDEFEIMCKDLLEVERNIKLENFKTGKDGGIDLRYSKNKKENIIIQCKRYNNFQSLKVNLQKEVSKVRKLNPKKYIIMTSAGLSPGNKEYIQDLFQGYIIKTSDIIGGDEIKSLLGNHKQVERKHYKLWLSSTNTLQSIVNNNILNRSEFTEQQIKNKIRVYVQNESFSKAQQMLKEEGFLILSGSPGVGKTTLAEILSYSYIASGYNFIEISEDIDEGEKVFIESEKQIFYYDDFLGRNFLERNLSKNEDRRLLNFINKVVLSPNKIFIMTTREYILRQAQLKHDLLKDKRFDFNKYIINVENYNKFIRAKILYNHVYFSEVPPSYVRILVEGKAYQKIIQHKNYNPRIINLMTNKMIIEDISEENYPKEFINKLDYPNEIWEHVFENQIEEASQNILLLLMVMGTKVDLLQLENNFNNFNILLNNKFNNRAFKNGIRELEKTFIRIYKESITNTYIVTFQNPSIQDFLLKYSSKDNSIIEMIWNTTLYLEPLLKTFSGYEIQGKIKIPAILKTRLVKILVRRFDEYEDCGNNNLKLSQLRIISDVFNINEYEELKTILTTVIKEITSPYLGNVTDYLFLINKFKNILFTEIDYKECLFSIIDNSQLFSDLEHIIFIKNNFSEIYNEILNEINLGKIIDLIWEDTESDFENCDVGELESVLNTFEEVGSTLDIDTSDYISRLEAFISEVPEPDYEDMEEYYMDDYRERFYEGREDEEIEALFDTLLEKID